MHQAVKKTNKKTKKKKNFCARPYFRKIMERIYFATLKYICTPGRNVNHVRFIKWGNFLMITRPPCFNVFQFLQLDSG